MVGFSVLFGFVVLGLVLFTNCLIPFSSHKSCGDFQVSVKGHWTYSWAYVWVRRVSLRLFNLDCRYPRDQMQPAREKNSFMREFFIVVHVLNFKILRKLLFLTEFRFMKRIRLRNPAEFASEKECFIVRMHAPEFHGTKDSYSFLSSLCNSTESCGM